MSLSAISIFLALLAVNPINSLSIFVSFSTMSGLFSAMTKLTIAWAYHEYSPLAHGSSETPIGSHK